MKMTIKANRFREIVAAAQEEPDQQQFLAAYGLPVWIAEEITANEETAVELLKTVHSVANMAPKDLIAAAGLKQTTFARRFGIPLRTVQDWCGQRRTMPEYLKFMAAELLGLLPDIQIQV